MLRSMSLGRVPNLLVVSRRPGLKLFDHLREGLFHNLRSVLEIDHCPDGITRRSRVHRRDTFRIDGDWLTVEVGEHDENSDQQRRQLAHLFAFKPERLLKGETRKRR